MERLGDILNQITEQTAEESSQIALPPIKGSVRYDNVKFRFGNSGPYQVDEVSLEIGLDRLLALLDKVVVVRAHL